MIFFLIAMAQCCVIREPPARLHRATGANHTAAMPV
jgi:hypothetical protein